MNEITLTFDNGPTPETTLQVLNILARRKILANFFVPSLVSKERVFDALMGYGMESITLFYNVVCQGYGIKCNTADCYRALYLYRCHR